MTKRQLMNRVVERAAAHNMLVLLDMHRLDDQSIPMLWFSADYSVNDVYKGWDTVLGDLKQHWNGTDVCVCMRAIGVIWSTTSDLSSDTQTLSPLPTQCSAST